MKALEQLYREHQGNVSDKWSHYLAEYDRVLAPYRDRPISLLEIGIQNGGSLEIWSKYFANAREVVGCDINPACAAIEYADTRVAVVIGDVNLDATEQAISAHAECFDFIIDDGSHRSDDVVNAFLRYFPRVKEGGIFIVEDLHCSYWSQFDGGLYHPYSSIAFFKQLIDVLNREHWGVDKSADALLQGFHERFGGELLGEVFGTIHSVEFANSLCFVHKAKASDNFLGRRVIAGKLAPVASEVPNIASLPTYAPLQTGNVWSTLERAPAESWERMSRDAGNPEVELARLREKSDEYTERLAEFRQGVAFRDCRITELQGLVERYDSRMSDLRRDVERKHGELTVIREKNIELAAQVIQLKEKVEERERRIVAGQTEIDALRSSTSWRVTAPLRWPKASALKARSLLSKVTGGAGLRVAAYKAYGVYRREGLAGVRRKIEWLRAGAPGVVDAAGYAEWIKRYDQLDGVQREAIAQRVADLVNPPLISIAMPVYNPKPEWLAEAIDSVRAQLYPHWELCIADDVSTDPAIRPLLERCAGMDPRIKVVFRESNGHISAASNSALSVATGEWVALLDHDDLLPEHALYCVATAIAENPSAKLFYSDEDKIDEAGRRCDPYFKCAWNPDLFYSHNMFSHLGVYQKALLDEIGGFRIGLEGSQDYDLALRCIERVDIAAIHHIPRVLYHWRVHAASTASAAEAKPYAAVAGKRAIDEHLERKGVVGSVEYIGYGYRMRYALPDSPPLVSVIIPTRNAVGLMRQCIDSILHKTTYPNYEIIIVDNGSDDPASLKYFKSLEEDARIRVLRDDRPFNYSALNNAAVEHADGELVALVNNDIEVISPDWLSEMVAMAIQKDIGAVGAKLLYPNDTIQHAGLILGILGVAGNAHKHAPRSTHGYFGRASLINSFSAVTAACLVVRKSVYLEVGGFNETDLSVAYNDVDFCLRVREAGYRNVWTPYAELYHHESATRGNENDPVKRARFMSETNYMKRRWAELLRDDPAYSPNLTLDHDNFSLAWPPRVKPLT